jgi:hypothetical protein
VPPTPSVLSVSGLQAAGFIRNSCGHCQTAKVLNVCAQRSSTRFTRGLPATNCHGSSADAWAVQVAAPHCKLAMVLCRCCYGGPQSHTLSLLILMHSLCCCSPQVCSSVASGYSGLGESASQVCSRVSTPMARRAGGAAGSRAGGGGGSCAGASVTSSAIARIAALEQELAAAKVETKQLQKTITAMKTSSPQSAAGGLVSKAAGSRG